MGRRGALVLAAAAVVVALAVGIVVATRSDPYGPGTVHQAEVLREDGCQTEIRLDDRSWVLDDSRAPSGVLGVASDSWYPGVDATTGTLEVVDDDVALFHPEGSALAPIRFRFAGEPRCHDGAY